MERVRWVTGLDPCVGWMGSCVGLVWCAMVSCVGSDRVGWKVVLKKLDPRHIPKNNRIGWVVSWIINGPDPLWIVSGWVGLDPTYPSHCPLAIYTCSKYYSLSPMKRTKLPFFNYVFFYFLTLSTSFTTTKSPIDNLGCTKMDTNIRYEYEKTPF